MILSMTGYGRGVAQTADLSVVVEGRSLNHRFFETNVKLSSSSYILEKKIRDLIKSSFHRGKIDLYVAISKSGQSTDVPINYENAEKYYQALLSLCQHLGLQEQITISSLIPFWRDIFGSQEQSVEVDTYWPLIEEALKQAIQSIQEMRLNEGEALHKDIKNRIDIIESIIKKIEGNFPQLIIELRKQLTERITEHFPDITVEPGRLEQELAILAEKIDITEEVTRLNSHLNQVRELLDGTTPAIGRKLDFLLQEIHREVNTVGYKVNNAEMSQHAVDIKAELEKIREQAQNIE